MRRFVVICLVVLSALVALWKTGSQRAVTILTGESGYELTWAVAWNMGMAQRFTFTRPDASDHSISGGWSDVRDKPYNAGATVYRSTDGVVLYLGMLQCVLMFNTSTHDIAVLCDAPARIGTRHKGKDLREA